MKRKGIVVTSGVALATTFATFAHAQSVTAFGTLDVFAARGEGTQRIWRLDDGGNAASRLGFRGSEDLGGGLRANFLLEGGFAPDTGAGTVPGPAFAWTRQSFVGLSGGWGSIDAGRMYTPMFYTLFRADPLGLNAVFSPLNLVSATDAQTGINAFAARGSNMLRLRTPATSQWIADVAYSMGESAADSRRSGDIYGVTIGWQNASYYIGYGLQRTRAGSAAAPDPSPATTTYQALSAAWKMPVVQLYGHYIRNSSSLPTVNPSRVISLGIGARATEALQLTAMAAHRDVRGSDRKQWALTLGADYALSKRTFLYTRVLGLDNQGASTASLAQVPVTTAGTDVRVYAVGVRHNF